MAANEKDATENREVASDFDADKKDEAQTEGLSKKDPLDEPSSGATSDPPLEPELGDESVSDPTIRADDSLGDDVDPPASADESRRYSAGQQDEDPAPVAAAEPLRDPEPVPDPEPEPEPHPERVKEPVHAEDYADDQGDEHEGSSFAARLLTFLILLIIGAGLGIWGAPKLAPMLPAGLAPVAEWLSPADPEAEAQIADLSARLDALAAEVAEAPSESVTAADIDAAVTEARASIDDQLNMLRTAVEDVGGTETAEQLSALQSALDGQESELASLRQQLTEASASADQGGAAIDLYQAALEGLRGEVRTLTQRVAALGHRIDEVSATADRSISAAEAKVAEVQEEAQKALDSAAIEADLAIISAALAAGQPFQDAADRLSAAENVTLPDGLADVAGTGVPTLQSLRDDFAESAHAAIRASITSEAGDGFFQRSRAFLEAQLATRSLAPQEGDDTDAVLSRMEASLGEGDLSGALQEADALPADAAAAMDGWLTDARRRQAAEAGLAELEAGEAAMN